MPVKRRRGKRRIDLHAEAAAWSMCWQSGFDYFGEAADLTGLVEPVFVWPPELRPDAKRKWDAASDEAWSRVGHLSGLEARRAS